MIIHGDSLDVLKTLDAESVDSVVTDPPFGLKFMNRHWDYDVPSIELWREVLRVLKPGGYGLIACGTRTQHRMIVGVEDAGFEVRDVICHHYSSGFPKSRSMKAIGKPDFGTALKPATEFWTLVRKQLSEKTVEKNFLKHGTGALNIEASRIATTDNLNGGAYIDGVPANRDGNVFKVRGELGEYKQPTGRWPANVVLSCDCGDDEGQLPLIHQETCAAGELDRQAKAEVSRYFYCAKTSRRERNAGLEGMPEKLTKRHGDTGPSENAKPSGQSGILETNCHPCVKPIRLMEYLIRLITPPGGRCLDPFAGSGSTGVAAINLGFDFVGVEREAEYVTIAEARIAHAQSKKT